MSSLQKRGFFFLNPLYASDRLPPAKAGAGLCWPLPALLFPKAFAGFPPKFPIPAEKSVIARGLAFQFCPSPTASVCHQLLEKITDSRCSRQPSVSSPPRRIRAQEKELGLMLNQAVPLRPVHRCPLPSARNPSQVAVPDKIQFSFPKEGGQTGVRAGRPGLVHPGGPSHSGPA